MKIAQKQFSMNRGASKSKCPSVFYTAITVFLLVARPSFAFVVQTLPATSITTNSAQLNLHISLGVWDTFTYLRFQYGGAQTDWFHCDTDGNYAAVVSGLSPGSTYQFRAEAYDNVENITGYGGILTFTTLYQPGAPSVFTYSATSVTSTSAYLTGSIYPHGTPTFVFFDYGLTTNYVWRVTGGYFVGTSYQGVGCGVSLLTPNTTYHFRIVASYSEGTSYGGDGTFTTLPSPLPDITTQPESQTNAVGSNAVFTVVASGNAPLSFQWQFNGTNQLGATSPNLTLSNLEPKDAGNYQVIVSNGWGSITSQVATLTLYQAPVVILTPPQSQMAKLGDNVTLGVGISGSPPFSYQWSLNGSKLPGATNTQLVLRNIQTNSAGTYVVAVSNIVSVASSAATVTVAAVWIDLVSVSANRLVMLQLHGETNTAYEVQVSTNFTQQWKPVGGTVLQAGTNLFTNSAPAGPSVFYRMRLLTSSPPTIVAQPVSQTNVVGSTVSISVTASGYPFPVYQWQFNSVNLTNETNAMLTLLNAQTNQAGCYQVIISNSYGSVTSVVASLTVLSGYAPGIAQQPQSQTNLVGRSATFAVTATGTPPLFYQWLLNGTNLPGATSNLLVWPNLQVGQSGSYTVSVSNSFGIATSAVATLAVRTMPSLGEALNALVLSWTTGGTSSWVAQTNLTQDGYAAAKSGTITHNQQTWLQSTVTGPGSITFWWKVSSQASHDYLRFYVDGTQQAAISGEVNWQFVSNAIAAGSHTVKWVYSKDGSGSSGQDAGWVDQVNYLVPLPTILSQPLDQRVAVGANATFTVGVGGIAPFWYQWQRNGVDVPGANDVSLVIPNVQWGQDADLHVRVGNVGGAVTSRVARLTIYVAPPTFAVPPCDILAKAGTTATLSADVSGSPPFQYQWVFNGTNLPGKTNPTLVLPNVQTNAGGSYALAVWNSAGAVTSSPPAILTVGTVWLDLLSVSANRVVILQLHGEAGKAYEVQVSTNLANSVTWTSVGAATLTAGTNLFTNSAPTARSVLYRMPLLAPSAPVITTQPVSQTNEIGSTAMFAVVASGYPFPAYQWWFNGAAQGNGTNALLTLPNVQTNQAGSYWVIVTNSYGSVTSQVATLTVVPPRPRIQADSLTRTNGQFKFILQSQAGSRLQIQASTNLTTWTNLAILTNINGTIPFLDPSTNFKWRFYRAQQVP